MVLIHHLFFNFTFVRGLKEANNQPSQSPTVVRHFKKILRFTIYILTIVFGLTLFSCERIKRKGHEVVNKTKEKISEKKNEAVDKVVPTFDSYNPDTKFNKKRFEEFFDFAPTSDVKNIYCFDDQIGIDSKFIFSFKCDDSTKNRIVKHLNLTKSNKPDNYSSGLWQSFPWWDSAKIVTLNPYWSKSEKGYYKYLWFDKTKQMLYYIDFDM